MSLFSENIKFKYSWRTYQQRVIDNIKTHLSDKKLHVVAPPGSGKTVLGLEVALSLGKPVLILAPTITIRNQWKERLVNDFLDGKKVDWISKDIRNPGLVTVSTYQGLHAAIKSGVDLGKLFKKHNIQTIVVDECHHLQKEWWKSLIQIVNEIDPTVVSLTATPPYDVNPVEWERYNQLCGPVDEEIGVPELVSDHNLCPHQDYIYFSSPSDEEYKAIFEYRKKVVEFMEYLEMNFVFKEILKAHPFLTNPGKHLESIFENPSYFSSLLIIRQHIGGVIPKQVLEIIGADDNEVPELTLEWLEIFLSHALYKDEHFLQHEADPDFKKIGNHLRKIGAIERGKIRLTSPEKISKTLRTSTSKLDSIVDIVRLEYDSLKENLRMVILTDFIRNEAMPRSYIDINPIEQIGVVPIFELIRRQFPVEIEVGVLSGSVVIVPRYSEKMLDAILAKANLSPGDIVKKSLAHDENYYLLEAKEKAKNKLVQIVTALFEQGGIHVLVGTKSLLGEGWDAPAINSLVLATVVGSYVYSNQMRGRAIRTFKQDENKTSNIWHLVCVENDNKQGGHDIKILKRRFRAFHGISFDAQPAIQNGMDRFNLPAFPIDKKALSQLNSEMTIHAQNRLRLRDDWDNALVGGVHMVEEIKVPLAKTRRYRRVHEFLLNRTRRLLDEGNEMFTYMFLSAYFGGAAVGLLSSIGNFLPILQIAFILLIILMVLSYKKLPKYLELSTISNFFKPKISLKNLFLSFLLFTAVTSAFLFLLLGLTVALVFSVATTIGIFFWVDFVNSLNVVDAWHALQKHEETEGFLRKASIAILKTMQDMGNLKTPLNDLNLEIHHDENRNLTATLKGATTLEEHTFMEALQELVDPIDNARYILSVEKDWIGEIQETNYYAVPSIIGRNKKDVLRFQKYWQELLGDVEIIFTRNIDGRHTLLKARGQSFAENSHPIAERVSVWR